MYKQSNHQFLSCLLYTSISQKPSIIQSLKNENITYIYYQGVLSTDLYQNVTETQDLSTTQNVKKVEKSQPLEPQQQDKHFEPISFDDLFNDDF